MKEDETDALLQPVLEHRLLSANRQAGKQRKPRLFCRSRSEPAKDAFDTKHRALGTHTCTRKVHSQVKNEEATPEKRRNTNEEAKKKMNQ